MFATQIKTASDLKAFVQEAGHESHFFDRKTMAFFGAATFEWAESNHTIVVKNTSGQLLRVNALSLPGAVVNGGLL